MLVYQLPRPLYILKLYNEQRNQKCNRLNLRNSFIKSHVYNLAVKLVNRPTAIELKIEGPSYQILHLKVTGAVHAEI